MTAVKPRLVNLEPGLRAAQPDPADVAVGAIYWVTDESVLERNNGTTWEAYSGAAGLGGDVVGPASAVDDRIAIFDGTSGTLIADGGQTIATVLTAAHDATALVGDVPDANLSANVPLLNAANTFTNQNQIIQASASPGLRVIDTDEAADAKRFRLVVAGAAFYIQAVDDAESVATATLSMGRTGIVTNAGQPTAFVTKSGAQTLTNNTPTAITFDTETYDVGGGHDTATNNHRLTVPTGAGGTYMIIGNISYVANSAGLRAAALIKNGATALASVVINAVVGDGTSIQAVAVALLVAGDYVHLSALQTSGGNLDASASGTLLQWVKVW